MDVSDTFSTVELLLEATVTSCGCETMVITADVLHKGASYRPFRVTFETYRMLSVWYSEQCFWSNTPLRLSIVSEL